MLAKGINVKRNKVRNMNSGTDAVIKNPQNTMDRGIVTIIVVIANIAQNIIVVTGVHGNNGMTTEGTTIVITEMVVITKKMEVCISNLKMKTDVLYSQLGDSLLTTCEIY